MTATAPAATRNGSARLLAAVGRPPTRAEHLRTFGALPGGNDVLELAAASKLRGRGGAAFPTAAKLAAVLERDGSPVVVVNAAEGEPASKKDRSLLRVAPHLVLDGAALAARAVGSREVVFGIGRPAPELDAALRERVRREDRVTFELRRVPSSFVAGEETALVQALHGRPAKPTLKPPYPSERGLGGRPTLVQNVETLAHLALIARHGPAWYAGGTALVTLGGAVARPGVHEVPLGITLADLLASCGGVTADLAGVLVGGYFGRWIAPDATASVVVSSTNMGAGAILALPASTCAAAECARVVSYLAAEGARQCGPCRHGLPALAGAFARAERGEVERLAGLVARRGACRHPDGAAGFARSALDVFAEELARHAARGSCGRRDEHVLPTL